MVNDFSLIFIFLIFVFVFLLLIFCISFSIVFSFCFCFCGPFFVFLRGLLLVFVFECDTSYSTLAKDYGHLKQGAYIILPRILVT